MSTKIFNGYMLPNMSLKNLDAFVKKARKKMLEAHNEMGEEMTIKKAVRFLDMHCIYGAEKFEDVSQDGMKFRDTYSPYLWAYFGLNEKAQKAEQSDRRTDSDYDFKSNLCLFPIRGKILAMFFSQHQRFTDVWNSFDEVSEYNYWNNTDKPDELTDEQWERRRKDWDTALPGIGIPSENGFIIEFTKGFPSLFDMKLKENAHKYIDSLEKRATDYARQMVFGERYEQNTKGLNEEPLSLLTDMYIETNKWLKTEEGKVLIDKKAEELKEQLIPVVDFALLQTYFKDLPLGAEKNKE